MNQIVKSKIFNPLVIRKRCMDYASRPEPSECDTKKYGAVIGGLVGAVRDAVYPEPREDQKPKYSRKENEIIESLSRCVLAWLFQSEQEPFTPISRGSLTPQQINALSRWMSERRGDQWVERRTFRAELEWVLFWAKQAQEKTLVSIDRGGVIKFSEIIQECKDSGVIGSNDAFDVNYDLDALETLAEEVAQPEQAQADDDNYFSEMN